MPTRARRRTRRPRRRSTASRSRSRISTRRPGSERRSPARLRGKRPRLRPGARHEAQGRGLRHPRQDEHARVRHDRVHGLDPQRALPHAVGSVAERRRLERRRSRRARCRPVRDLPGLRRRRLVAHPRLVLRRARLQGLARPRLERAVRPRESGSARQARSPGRRPTPPPTSTSSAATNGATRSRPPPPDRPFAEEIGVDPGRLRVALTTSHLRRPDVDDACVAAAREAADLLASLGHEVEEAAPDWGGAELMEDFKPVWQISAVALSDARPVRAQPAQPGVPAGRGRDVERRSTRQPWPPAAARAEDRLVLVELRPAADADTRHAAGADRLGDRARGSVGAVRPRRRASRPSPPRSTSPASRRSRCRCTGPTAVSRSASSSSGRRSATHSSSECRLSSRRHVPGPTAGHRTPDAKKGRPGR